MEKLLAVRYEGGQSRYSEKAVDYMLAVLNYGGTSLELYAELPPDEHDECGTYAALKTEILYQANQHGIAANRLKFWFD